MDDISDSKELKELADVIILMHNRIGWDKIDGQIIGEFIIAKNTRGNIGVSIRGSTCVDKVWLQLASV